MTSVSPAAPAREQQRHLGVLPLAGLPSELSARIHERYDAVTGRTWSRAQVYPAAVDPDARAPFTSGVVAEIEWSAADGMYLVYVSGRRSAAYVQAAGQPHLFHAASAVERAAMEIRWELLTQQRGW